MNNHKYGIVLCMHAMEYPDKTEYLYQYLMSIDVFSDLLFVLAKLYVTNMLTWKDYKMSVAELCGPDNLDHYYTIYCKYKSMWPHIK